MLARLLLTLLAIVFATPVAAAACHAPVAGHHASAAHHGLMPVNTDEQAVATEACVGCVPPSNWIAPRVAEPIARPAAAPSTRVSALSLGQGSPPALPPPRIA